uniref:Uncharacterized protein n=1 Tax=Trypanosoma congolense (strain IL3000) TaxID=1068625 RepID=G0URH3_TRYCI|nr:conserved hypothetical protein [Trypanosoma congolense IL3000]
MLAKQLSVFRCTAVCNAVFRDLRSKELHKRREKELQKATKHNNSCDGTQPSPGTPVSSAEGSTEAEDAGDKESMAMLLEEQWRRRIARREAFLQWQAGQREKGAAERLVRQAKTQEKFKRHRYHTQSGRLISIGLAREDGTSSNAGDDVNFSSSSSHDRSLTNAQFLVPSNSRETPGVLNVFLQKR